MALRTTSTPLDQLTLTEWRNTIADWCGVSYANLSTSHQTELNRYIEEAHDYITKRMAHLPWAQRVSAPTLSASSTTVSMPADFRTMLRITETESGSTTNAIVVTKLDWYEAWGTGGRTTHPWAESSAVPRWYFDGMTSDNPPVAQWKRANTSTNAITLSFLYVPYFGLVSSDSYTELPAGAVPEIRHHIRGLWAAFRQEYEKANAEFALREQHIAASNVADNKDGAADWPLYVDAPSTFYLECEGP